VGVDGERYSRNASCALNWMSTFSFKRINTLPFVITMIELSWTCYRSRDKIWHFPYKNGIETIVVYFIMKLCPSL